MGANKKDKIDISNKSIKTAKRFFKIGILAFVLIAAGVLLVLSGVVHVKWYDNYLDKKAEEKKIAIAEAKDVFDLLPYIESERRLDKGCWYSDIKDYKKLANVFEVMRYNQHYAIFTYEGERYLALVYNSEHYQEVPNKINSVKQEYSGDKLTLTLEVDNKFYSRPYGDTGAKLFIKLDQDFNQLFIGEDEYSEFEGDFVEIDGKVGYVDKNLNVKIPVIYDDVEWMEAGDDFYKIKGEGGVGLLNTDKDFVFEAKYFDTAALKNGLYMVEEEDEVSGDITINIYNRHNEILSSYNLGDGYVDEIFEINNQANFKVKCKKNGIYYTGLLGDDWEFIIEPSYEDIRVIYTEPQVSGYYEVINKSKMVMYDNIQIDE
ncbi:MAG: hypothetical protein PUG10_09560 [Lachnospiraceae bacterium]|nr:hypothetical protein [Lachnospiraceae bacterium]